jgi:hypothetical protein
MAKKISELTEITEITDTDYIEVSEYDGVGGYLSKKWKPVVEVTQQSITGDGATTIDWKLGNKVKFTFGAMNEVFTFTAPSRCYNLTMLLIQDSVGGRNATWPASVKWLGVEPTWVSGVANKGIIVEMYYDGTNYWARGTAWET